MQPARASPPLSRLWQGLWGAAAMARWLLGGWLFFNLLLSMPVQEVSPWCLLPPQGLGSLTSARAMGVQQVAGCRRAQEPLCRGVGCQIFPGTWGDMGLAPSRSRGVKCLGLSCLSWLCGLMGLWED